jgi:hypothetical protein
MEHVHSRFSIVVGLPLLHDKSAPALRFRGLLSVRLRYGPHARQVALAALYTEGFSGFVTSTSASNATGWLTLQDSRPHVLFGTVLVKHLLDLISSFPQPV